MPVRRATAALAVLLAMLATGACDDEPEPKFADPTETPTTSEPSTPTPSVPVEPPLPSAASKLTKAGAIAFVEHFWRVGNYAQATGDVQPLIDLAAPSCRPCAAGTDRIASVYRRGGRIVGSEYTTRRPQARELRGGQLRLADVDILAASAAGRVVGAGDLNTKYPPGESDYRFTLVQDDDYWLVLDIEVSQ